MMRLSNIKVCHIIIGLGVGGAELMLKRLIECNRDDTYYSHSVISLTSIGVVGAQLKAINVEVVELSIDSVLDLPIAFWRLTRMLRSKRPDIVQTWMYHADLFGGMAARFAGIRNVIWGIRGTLIPQGLWSRTRFIIWLCANVSHWMPRRIVCCAEAALSSHVGMGYAVEKMVVIPNGYDLSVFTTTPALKQRVRDQVGFSSDSVVISTVGRFDPLKDYENFVKAAKLVGIHRPLVRFMMIGRGVDAANTVLVDWLADTGFADRFVLLGERNDIVDLMAATDIYCLASRAEGFPNVVAEAMAMQVPCVVTNAGDAASIVKDTGIVVPPQSSVALADALIAMVDLTFAQRALFGIRARKIIEKSYSIEVILFQYKSLYSSVIS